MKILFIVIDGLADKPIKELGNKTPLEAANTPNLDFLAKNGICGLITPFQFPWQKAPQSDSSHLALFGYDPKIYYLGRGVYEVSGMKMVLKKNDLALRVNFATVDENLKIIDRRAGRIEETEPLARALNGIQIDGIRFLIKKSYGHRAGLLLRGKGLSASISDGDPDKVGVKPKRIIPKDNSKEARFTAGVLNEFLEKAYLILKEHPLNKQGMRNPSTHKREKQGPLPANYLLVRGAGFFEKTPSFNERYGLKACAIAGGTLYKGIAGILGMDLIEDKRFTGKSNTDIRAKVSAAKKALASPTFPRKVVGGGYDFCYLHIKAADTFSHDGDFRGKSAFIERVDKALLLLLKLRNCLTVVSADHATCSKLKKHCQEPVPVLIWGQGRDGVAEFSERACQQGGLGKIKALELMPIICQMSNVRCQNH